MAAVSSTISTDVTGTHSDMDYDYLRQIYTETSLVACLNAVEEILGYRFRDRKLIEAALTHPSYKDSASYQRLEFVGDAALGLALANHFFLAYPSLGPGQLSLLRAANTSTEKLARVAVKHGLYRFVRRNAPDLDEQVIGFALAVKEEEEPALYGGTKKALKVLADIVESIAAAVYVDSKFDLKALDRVFRGLLEPIVTLETLVEHPQPVAMLYEICQKQGKQVDIRSCKEELTNITSIYIDRKFIASGVAYQKEISRLSAARETLKMLAQANVICVGQLSDTFVDVNDMNEIESAKQKLHVVCGKKKWPTPFYRIEKEVGPDHQRRFICSVQIITAEDVLLVMGDEKSKRKNAENSAASSMIRNLVEAKYIAIGSSLQPQLPV